MHFICLLFYNSAFVSDSYRNRSVIVINFTNFMNFIDPAKQEICDFIVSRGLSKNHKKSKIFLFFRSFIKLLTLNF